MLFGQAFILLPASFHDTLNRNLEMKINSSFNGFLTFLLLIMKFTFRLVFIFLIC